MIARRDRTSLRPGFTLLELLVVMGILGTLTSVTMTAVNPIKQLKSANDAKRLALATQLQKISSQYVVTGGTYPFDKAVPQGKANAMYICRNNFSPASCLNMADAVPNSASCIPYETWPGEEQYIGYKAYTDNSLLTIESTHIGQPGADKTGCDRLPRPVAYWNFEEGASLQATDITGRGHTATGQGSTSGFYPFSAGLAPSLQFPNTYSRLFSNQIPGTCGASSSSSSSSGGGNLTYFSTAQPQTDFDFEYNQPFSISAWIWPMFIANHGYAVFSKQDANATLKGYRFGFDWTGTCNFAPSFEINDDAGAGRRILVRAPNGAVAVNVSWYNIVVTYNGNGKASGVKMYINGIPQTLTTVSDTFPSQGATIRTSSVALIGNDGYNQPPSGFLDEIRVYNKTLTPSDAELLSAGEF